MRTGAETVIFWGAGATASIGLRTTQKQANAVRHLVYAESSQALPNRVTKALAKSIAWVNPFTDLLLVLGDDTDKIHHISPAARNAMSRHWGDTSDESLDERVHELRAIFDWPALKAVVRACPGFENGVRFQLQDVLNLIDLHATSFHGFPSHDQFLSPDRLVAARRALQLVFGHISNDTCFILPHHHPN